MVAPVPAQISKLRHCPTPRSLRIYPLPTTHCPLSSSHPSSASRGVNIPPVLSSFRILPVATGVYPTTDLRIFRDANSFASYHIPATPAVSCNYALFCATGAPLSLLFSTASTLFLSPRGWYPCCLRAPASGSSVLRFFPQLLALCFQQLAASFFLFALFLPTQLFVFNRLQTLFQKHRGWGWAHNPAIWNQQHPDSFFPRLVLLGALRASVANPLRFRISPQPAWWRRVRGCRCE
jgi:hypothetical protein